MRCRPTLSREEETCYDESQIDVCASECWWHGSSVAISASASDSSVRHPPSIPPHSRCPSPVRFHKLSSVGLSVSLSHRLPLPPSPCSAVAPPPQPNCCSVLHSITAAHWVSQDLLQISSEAREEAAEDDRRPRQCRLIHWVCPRACTLSRNHSL